MAKDMEKKIGDIEVSKYLRKNDNSLLRLNEAKIIPCTLPDDEAKSRGCTESGECEELVLVYRPFGCIREKHKVDLNEMTTVSSKASPSARCALISDGVSASKNSRQVVKPHMSQNSFQMRL